MILTREQAKEEIKRNWKRMTAFSPDGKGRGIICPNCGSGSGKHGTGISEDPKRPGQLHCWACGFSGDVLDLLQASFNCDFNTAFNMAAEELGIDVEQKQDNRPAAEMTTQKAQEGPQKETDDKTPTEGTEGRETSNTKPAEVPDFTEYYKECANRITDQIAVTYLQGRGISLETAQNNFLGFDPAADPAGKGYKAPRIIIPVTKSHYIGRALDPAEQYQKINNAGSKPGIFNGRKVYESNPVFVTEGVFDSLAVEEMGQNAIALNSTSNADLLVKTLSKKPTDRTLILCLDNDEAGQKATKKLAEDLERLHISFIIGNIAGKHKDANEALQADRTYFEKTVKETTQAALRPDNVQLYVNKSMFREIEDLKAADEKKTGFEVLDYKAGGIYPGLYVIAALSSLGKTTFALQLADGLATSGNDVLFFSMEQSRLELVSKSLARIARLNYDMGATLQSKDFRFWKNKNVMDVILEKYIRQEGEHMSIIEGNFDCTVSTIRKYVESHISRTGIKPIVFIDYLQILQPGEEYKSKSTRESIDNTVQELKRLSRSYNITIFVISSVNRSNYLTPIDFESLKESGGIEYTADVIWGLQLRCLEEDLFNSDKKIKEKRERIKNEKKANPRKIELVCLKNRYGISSFEVYFNYYPDSDFFVNVKE